MTWNLFCFKIVTFCVSTFEQAFHPNCQLETNHGNGQKQEDPATENVHPTQLFSNELYFPLTWHTYCIVDHAKIPVSGGMKSVLTNA